MKPTRRDPLKELTQLLRAPEPGAKNIVDFLFAHADVLAAALGSTPDDLRASAGLPDEVVAPRVQARLARRREDSREQKAGELGGVAARAAHALGRTVRWSQQAGVLDVRRLLGDLLLDRRMKYIAFADGDFNIAVERELLSRTSSACRPFTDVTASVDSTGLHIRWRGGRGGYNWRPQFVPPAERDLVLTVELQPQVVALAPRSGAWLSDLLQEVGFAV